MSSISVRFARISFFFCFSVFQFLFFSFSVLMQEAIAFCLTVCMAFYFCSEQPIWCCVSYLGQKTSELWLSLNSVYAVLRLFPAISLFLFHTFFLPFFWNYIITLKLSDCCHLNQILFSLYLKKGTGFPLRKVWKKKSRWLCKERWALWIFIDH